ncbi:conserved hypothetical protein [Burkholderia cepacia]|nr:conserved hypothetical protein [Burkholderia cepacia]
MIYSFIRMLQSVSDSIGLGPAARNAPSSAPRR